MSQRKDPTPDNKKHDNQLRPVTLTTESGPIQTFVQVSGAPPLYALIIAIDDYPDTVQEKLLGAVNDAKAMIDHLERILGVPSSQITTLFNDQATRVGILHALRALAHDDRIKSGDPILIYYAGYGSTEPTPDGSNEESSVNQMIIPQNYGEGVHGIRDRTIARLIDRIAENKGDNITVIFDCSFSGSAVQPSKLYPTHRVRGFFSEDKQPANLDEDILKDCPDQEGLAPGLAKGFSHTGIRSHVVLTACREAERAQEGRRGVFTEALLDTLYLLDAEKITYRDLIGRIPDLAGQSPQCAGQNVDRRLFNSMAPVQERRYYPVRKEGTQYVIDVGAVSGLTIGAEFSLHEDKDSISKVLALLKVVETSPFIAKMEVVSENPPSNISSSALVLQTRAGQVEYLRLHIPDNENFDMAAIRKEVISQMYDVGPMQREIVSFVDKDKAELEMVYEDGHIVFNILNKRVSEYGLTRTSVSLDSKSVRLIDDIFAVIWGAAHYHRLLKRSAAKDGKQGLLQGKVNIEFTTLEWNGKEWENDINPLLRQTGDHLIRENVIDLVTDDDALYGLKITNISEVPLFLSVFYFGHSDFRIELWFTPRKAYRRSIVLPTLQPKESLIVGNGSSGGPPARFYLRDEQDVDVGFIKVFVSTERMDWYSANRSSPFDPLRPPDFKKMIDPRSAPIWDTVLLTHISRRHGLQEV